MSGKGDYYPLGPNMWVANMAYAADVSIEGKLSVLLTPIAPVAASATALLNAQSVAATPNGSATLNMRSGQGQDVMGKFGRCLVAVASTTFTQPVKVFGFDYLGQPMSETVTMNSGTPVNMNKAFRRVNRVTWATGGAVTISLGTRDCFGLPYAYLDAGVDFTDGAKNGSQGTFVVPVLTAQTATTTDPRGTWAPAAAADGVKKTDRAAGTCQAAAPINLGNLMRS